MDRIWKLSLSCCLLAASACQVGAEPPPPGVASAAEPLFVNGGFETGALAPDWTVTTFLNSTGIGAAPWPPVSATTLNLTAGGINDTHVVTNAVPESQLFAGMTAATGVPRWPKFGTSSVVVNELGAARNVNSLKQAYTTTNADVDPADGKIHVRFVLAPALQAAGHTQQLQPYFFVALRNRTPPRVGDLFSSFNFSNSPGTPWKIQGAGATAVLYTDWTIFDIAPGNIALEVGDSVEIEVYAAGCQPNAHWGEVYVDGFGAAFPGLSISKTAPVQINLDSDLTYSFLVKNNTTGVAPNVVADEVLPANTTFVAVNAPGATCTTPAVGGTGTVSCNFGWMNAGASATFTVTVHAYAPATSGGVSAAGASTLTDGAKAWAVNAWRGWTVYLVGGTGAGQQRFIGANTATQLTVSNAWTTQPDPTTTYAVANAPAVQSTATAGNATTLTNAGMTWVANQWSGWTLAIVAGQGVGQQRLIDSNTATVLTIAGANFAPVPNNTSVYAITRPAKVTNGDFGVSADTFTRMLGQRVETAITGGVPFTDLAVTKSDGVPAVGWGGATQYAVTVVNHGPLAVTNALVTDIFPPELDAGSPWTCAGTGGGTCTTANGVGSLNHTVSLPVGASATFTINAQVNAGTGTGTLRNVATVAPPAGVTDNVPSNDSDVDLDGLGTLVPLTVDKGAGEGGLGTVTSSPAGISCGPSCTSETDSFVSGTAVVLTAVARTGDTFTGWTGACTGASMTCTVTVSAAATATAHFKGLDVVGSAPGGNGTVTCVPSDVAQGGSSVCTATPAAGYGLASLTDNGVAVTASVVAGSYTLTNVTANHAVVGVFGPLPLTPLVTAPASAATTGDNRPPVSGTTSPGAAVTVLVDGAVVCSTTADGAGAFSCTPAAALADGLHTVTATATNANGTTPASAPVSFTVDTAPPAAPVVTAPADGSSTSALRPPISGTAEAGSTVTVTLDGVVVGTAAADSGGAWAFTPPADLAQGPHTASATATDAGGNVSAVSNTPTFTVDTAAPAAPVVTAPASGATTGPSPTVTGTAEAGSTVTVTVDGVALGTATADASGAWTFAVPVSLAAGSHAVFATAADAAGNVSPPSNTNPFTVVAPVPPAPALTAPGNGSVGGDSTPTFTGTAQAGTTVTVTVDGQPVCTAVASGAGAWSCTPTAALGDGPHVATASAADANGSSPESPPLAFTIDTTAPLTPVVVGPADGSRTADPTPTVTGTGEPGSTVAVRVDGVARGTATVQPDGTWSFEVPSALALGGHTVSATATDAAGNVSLPSNTNGFTVESPGAPVVTTPADNAFVNTATPALGGTAPAGATVTVRVDGAAVCTATADGAGAWSCTPAAPLSEGVHAVDATIPDGAGGTRTSNTDTFTVDTAAPAAPVVLSPADGSTTSEVRPPVSGTAEPFSTVTVVVDGVAVGTAVADASGAWALVPPAALALGLHTVSARATDRAGNTSPDSATNTFTVATSGGAPVLLTPPDGQVTRDATPVLSGTAAPGASVEARVDGAVVCTATASSTGAWSCTPAAALAQGAHQATANEAGSTASSNANSFTVDTVAPAPPVVERPLDGSTTSPTPTISGTAEAGARVEASVDGAPVCVTLADAQGRWACTVGAPLAAGPHAATATATDAAGNVSGPSNTNTFTVGAGAATITAPASGSTLGTATPTFTGTAPPGSTVVVEEGTAVLCTATADAQGAWSCTPATALADGPHQVTATATVSGVEGPASPPTAFTVDTRPPVVSISGPQGQTRDPAAHFELSSDEEPVTYTCSVDGGAFVPCDAVVDLAGLAPGPHTLDVRATDAAGNVGEARTEWVVVAGSFAGGGCGCSGADGGAFLGLALLALLRRRVSSRLA